MGSGKKEELNAQTPAIGRIRDLLMGPEMNELTNRLTGKINNRIDELEEQTRSGFQDQEQQYTSLTEAVRSDNNQSLESMQQELEEKLKSFQQDYQTKLDKIKKEIHQSGKEYRNSFKGLEEEVHSLEKRINSYIKELSSLDDKKEKAILTTIANLEDELERFTLLQKRINGQVKKKLGLRQIDFNDPQS
ncbi:MAG TPA: hypothetical protein VJ939_03405 [Bacteroidales bacterium]|nr:hypothetical protein [Bacteroidales bacterium]